MSSWNEVDGMDDEAMAMEDAHAGCAEMRKAVEAKLAADEVNDQRSLRLIALKMVWKHVEYSSGFTIDEVVSDANVVWQFLANGVILAPGEKTDAA